MSSIQLLASTQQNAIRIMDQTCKLSTLLFLLSEILGPNLLSCLNKPPESYLRLG